MKLTKRIFSLLLVLLVTVFLVACGAKNKFELTSNKTIIGVGEKANLSVALTFNRNLVEDILDDVRFSSSNETVLSVSSNGEVLGLKVGESTITASLTYEGSNFESTLKITVKQTPKAPANLKITNDILTWDAISGAEFVVSVNGGDHNVSSPSFNLGSLNLPYGSYEVIVVTKLGNEQSLPTAITYVKVDPQLEAETYKAALLFIDEDYVPNMKRSDFYYEEEYETYLELSKLARAYTNGALVAGIPLNKTNEVLGVLKTIEIEETNNFEELALEIKKLDVLGLTGNQIAAVLVEFVEVAFDQMISNEEIIISRYEGFIEEYKLIQNDIKNRYEYREIMKGFKTYGSEADLVIINNLINGSESSWWYQHDIYWIRDSIENDYLDDYIDGFDETLRTIALVMKKAYDANDDDFLMYMVNEFYIIDNIREYNYEIENYQETIANTKVTIQQSKEIQAVYVNNKHALRTSLTLTINFVLDFYEAIDSNLINALDNLMKNETLEEAFILKNELVAILKETLPSAQDFEQMFMAFVVIGSEVLDINASELVGFASNLGLSANLSITLMLELLDDITQTKYNEIIAIVEDMIIINNDEYYYYETYDPVKVVELIVYLGEFKMDFEEEQAKLIADMLALNTQTFEGQVELVINKFFEKVISSQGMSQTDINMMLQMFALQLQNQEINKLILKYGNELLNHFVLTKGKLALDIIQLSKNAPYYEDLKDYSDDIKAIGAQIFTYHNLVIPRLTNSEINALSDLITNNALYFFFNISAGSINDPSQLEHYNEFVIDITPVVRTVIKNAIKLEIELVNTLEANDAFNEFARLTENYDEEDSALIPLTKALDDILTSDNQKLVKDTLELVFTNVLGHKFVLEVLGLPETELAEAKAEITDFVDQFFVDIKRISAYDYNNLTQQQLNDFYDVWY